MKDNIAENAAAQGAEARQNTGATAAGLGKFKDADALLRAYNSLEAEFTRRSRRLRELEEKASEQGLVPSAAGGGPAAPAPADAERAGQKEAAPAGAAAGEGERAARESAVPPALPFAEGTPPPARPAVPAGGADAAFAAAVARAVEDYIASRPPAVMAEGGGFAPAPAPRVRTLEEAARLARAGLERDSR